ncbi:MAG: LLM class flavin-dependent oxidoreductase [Actinomycetota bacterium]|nr:LLM class flavin-dependent oxidoreductase [Actinomycetota bacterium]
MLPTILQGCLSSSNGTSPPGSTTSSTNGAISRSPEGPDDLEAGLRQLPRLCRDAEALGTGTLWACDHLFWHRPVLECLTALTVAAANTTEPMLGSCVLQLPLRQPAVVAKQAASIQTLSSGRLLLGVGVGSHPGEYDEAGADYRHRGRELDRGIAELRRCWAAGAATSAGLPGPGHTETAGDGTLPDRRYRQLPQPEPVPVWVGGSSEAALRRAAAVADGWIPLFLGPADYAAALDRLEKETERVGRAPGSVVPSIVLFVSVDEDAEVARARGTAWMSSLYRIPAHAFRRHIVAGTPASVAAAIDSYRQAGAAHVALYVTDDDPLHQFTTVMTALGGPAGIDLLTRGPRGQT